MSTGIEQGADGLARCFWATSDPLYLGYHDNEWGYPVSNDIRLFEKMTLESFQSGLSWLTILRKRENFREAFHGFDFQIVQGYGDHDVERLLGNAGIVRHRGKIESAINNAGVASHLVQKYGSLAAYVWQFQPTAKERPDRVTWEVLSSMAHTEASRALSKDLKKHGWRFFGPTTAYAFMQAMGLVNDHLEGCWCRPRAEEARNRRENPALAARQA